MTGAFDVVVAGAGHNSLVAAAYLAKAGLSCLVLEARQDIGGDTSSEELTLPGFWHDSCSTAHNLIQASPVLGELGLAEHGLEYLHPDPVVHLPFPDGSWLTMWRDEERTRAEFAKFSPRDGDAYAAMMVAYRRVAPGLGRARYTPLGFGDTTRDVLAREPDAGRWLRRNAMSAWEVIVGEFADEHTRAFMLWMSFMTMQPPERPGTGLLAYSLAYGRQRHSWTLPRGGSAALPTALASVIEAHGGAIVTGTRVTGLVLRNGRCAGVETERGEKYLASRAVLSTIHVKHLVEMAPARAWGEDFRYGVGTWQPGVSMFVTHYATTEPPRFDAGDGQLTAVASGTPESAERMLRLGTDFRAGRIAVDDPVLLVLCPTVADPSRAPAGRHTLKVVGFQPYELPAGPERWDELKDGVSQRQPGPAAQVRAERHRRGHPGVRRQEPARPRAHERAQLAWLLPRRRRRPGAVRRPAPCAWLGKPPDADSRALPDRGHHPSWRLGERRARTERGHGHTGGSRQIDDWRVRDMAIRTFGTTAVDWEQRVDFDRLRTERLARLKEHLERSELGALLSFDMANTRYMTATHIGTWAMDKLIRFALLPRGGEPVVWDFGSAARHHQLYNPWLDHTPGEPTAAGAARTGAQAGISTLRGAFHPDAGIAHGAGTPVRPWSCASTACSARRSEST